MVPSFALIMNCATAVVDPWCCSKHI